MENRFLRQYCEYVLRQPKLTAEEERGIAREARSGKPELLSQIILSNLDISLKQTWRMIDSEIDTWDLIQTGNYGLCYAAKDYDPEGSYPFKNVANIRVFDVIKNTISECSNVIRIPTNKFDKCEFIYRLRLELEYDDYDFYQEIIESNSMVKESIELSGIEINPSEIIELNLLPRCRLDYDELEEKVERGVLNEPPEILFNESRFCTLENQLRTIEDVEQKVIRDRFGIGKINEETLQDIGDRLGLTRERIRQIQTTALLRLRHSSRSRKLRPYLSSPTPKIQLGFKQNSKDFYKQRAETKRRLLTLKKEQFRRCCPEILNSFRINTGLRSKDFLKVIGERIKQFLNEEGEPQNFQSIYTDLLNVYEEVPRESVHMVLHEEEELVAIKKGTYALKEWGFVPVIYERKDYEVHTKEAVLSVLNESKSGLSLKEIRERVIAKFGITTSTHPNTIRAAVEKIDGVKQDEFGRYLLIKEERHAGNKNTGNI